MMDLNNYSTALYLTDTLVSGNYVYVESYSAKGDYIVSGIGEVTGYGKIGVNTCEVEVLLKCQETEYGILINHKMFPNDVVIKLW